jgi:hypothetical protein
MLPIIENGCGSCTACCTVLGVKDLRKDHYSKCQHECAGGCAIYKMRPKECRTYQCLWISSPDMIEDLRPDKLGVILEVSQLSIGPAVVVREVWLDASKSDLAQQFIDLVAEQVQGFIYVVRPNHTRSAYFPPWAAHLAPLAEKFREYGWRDIEAKQKKDQIVAHRKEREDKKRRRKQANHSKKRNR